MNKDYKAIIKDKRLEAGKLMTKEQIVKCNATIHTATIAAGAVGAIPIPAADAIPISGAQILMVITLGKIFNQKISETAAKAIIGAAASTFIGRQLFKFVPVVGWIASAGIAAGITEAIGWMVAVDFAERYRQEFKAYRNAKKAASAYAEAKHYKEAFNRSKEEAEDFSEE